MVRCDEGREREHVRECGKGGERESKVRGCGEGGERESK